MFTGLIQGIGKLAKRQTKGSDCELTIEFGSLAHDNVSLGDSIAVNGVCLTVTGQGENHLTADVSAETLRLTTLGSLPLNSRVNLEKSLTPSSFLGGHLVSGHVDGIAQVDKRSDEGRSQCFVFTLGRDLLPYVAKKGSICVDGISLTVNQVFDDSFSVNIVPHTLQHTNLHDANQGTKVNIEVDILARYIERLLQFSSADTISRELLEKSGFLSKS